MDGPVQEITRQVAVHGFWIKDFFVFIAASALVVPLFHRARIGAVAGFLLVGVAVGPYGLGRFAGEHEVIRLLTIEDRERVTPFAELGVMFLLFLIGLELSFTRLWALRRFVLGVGTLQFAASALAVALIAKFIGASGMAAVLLGLAVAMSSTAVVMQILEESGRTASPLGKMALSVLLFQDLMVAPILFGVELVGREGSTLAADVSEALLQAAVAFALLAVAGRYLLRPLFRYAAKTGSRELIMAMTILIVVGAAGATGAAGLSTALGAFFAGMLLGETEYRHQIEIDLGPFKGLLLGLFFVTVGMGIDISTVAGRWLEIGAAVVLLIVVKALILFGASRAFGVSFAVSVEVGMLLAQAGEFGFVVIGLSRGADLMAPDLAQFATAVVGLSMLITPIGAALAVRIGERLQQVDHGRHMPSDDEGLRDHVVIGGYGRVGQALARMLEEEHVPFIALDTDGDMVSARRSRGDKVFYGDAGRIDLLRRAGAGQARAFAATMNSARAVERMVVAARRENPGAVILARARDLAQAERLTGFGAVGVVPETLETSLQLGRRLLEELGLPDEAVERRLDGIRRRESRRAAGQAKTGA